MKKFLSLLLIILGIVIFIFGSHVSQKANQIKEKISQAQESNQGSNRPILGPVRRNVKNIETQQVQKKIGQAQQKETQTQITANWFYGAAIVLFICGIIGFILSRKSRK